MRPSEHWSRPLPLSGISVGCRLVYDRGGRQSRFCQEQIQRKHSAQQEENQLPIKLIRVSVFGADLGAALARRFIEELLESVCTKVGNEYRYEDSKVEVIFAGLFDAHGAAARYGGYRRRGV